MSVFQAVDSGQPPAAVLLVMLPPVWCFRTQPQGISAAALATLQSQLGPAVQLLRIDEATHPAILSSFAPAQLPTSALRHYGAELWRRPGLPNAAEIDALLVGRNGGAGT